MISESKRVEIQKQAKKILDNFNKSLSRVELKKKAASEEIGGFRHEGNASESDNDFRARVFQNAPSKEGDFILAEKKKW